MFFRDIVSRTEISGSGRSAARNHREAPLAQDEAVVIAPDLLHMPRDVENLIAEQLASSPNALRNLYQSSTFGRDLVRREPPVLRARNISQLRHIRKRFPLARNVNIAFFDADAFSRKIGARALQPLAHLANLQALQLGWMEHYSDAAIRFIGSLQSAPAINLRVPRHVSDAQLDLVSQLPGIVDIDSVRSGRVTDAGLAKLTTLQKLQSLHLDDLRSVTADGLHPIGQLQALTELRTWQMTIGKSAVDHLTSLGKLRRLDITTGADVDDEALRPLSALTALEHLDLTAYGPVSGAGLQQFTGLTRLEFHSYAAIPFEFASLPTLTHLRELELRSSRRLQDNDLAHISQIPRLHTLDLSGCENITPQGLSQLRNCRDLQKVTLTWYAHFEPAERELFVEFPALTKLHFNGAYATRELGALPPLGGLKALRSLRVDQRNSFTDENMNALAGLRSLEELDVSFSRELTGSGFEQLGDALALKRLKLSHCENLQDLAFTHIAALPNVTDIDASHCRAIGDSALTALGQAPALERFTISECHAVTDQGFAELHGLKTLREFRISHAPQLTGAGLQGFADHPVFMLLDIADCQQLTDEAIKHASRLPKLETFSLTGSELLTGRGLGELVRLPKLRVLRLYRNPLLADAHVRELRALTQLQELSLSWCPKVSARTVAILQKALPNCRISHST